MQSKITANVSTISPVAQPNDRAFAREDEVTRAGLRDGEALELVKSLPVPRALRFYVNVLLRVSEDVAPNLSSRELIQVAARRETKVWFANRPRRAALHRRLNTRRWRFARDGTV